MKAHYWKLTLEYDGTRYSGWQEQKNAETIAGEIKKAATKIVGPDVSLDGAGRTDAGVHALCQVARLKVQRGISADNLRKALNRELPKDINILKVEESSEKFDPRRDAECRYYIYQIATRKTAFAKRFVWWVQDPLNLNSMTEAAGHLVGRHDFERFADKRGEEGSTIVVVQSAEIGTDGDLILFRIGASHFLWKMVRRLVGVLVEVGLGNLTASDVQQFVTSAPLPQKLKSFSIAAHTAPGSGLFLERVVYGANNPPAELAAVFPVHRI
jgi:tRNA pseudouridine38-40 synthase